MQAADCAGQGLQCTLEVQVMLPRAKPRRSSSTGGEGSWTTIWERPVLFSDDAARIRDLQVCTSLAVLLAVEVAADILPAHL